MKQSYSLKDALKKNAKDSFLKYSSIKVENLISKSVCKEACNFVYDNEDTLIDKYKFDPRGLSIDVVNDRSFIKYFEYPFRENSKIFGRFVTSDVFRIAATLLKSKGITRIISEDQLIAL